MNPRILLVLPFAGLLALAGCQSAPAVPAPSATSLPSVPSAPTAEPVAVPEVGDCLADFVETDATTGSHTENADPESIVDCTEPHTYEVLAWVELPTGWIDPSASLDEIAAQRDEVYLPGGEHFDEYVENFEPLCDAALTIATGLESVELGGVDALDAGILPDDQYFFPDSTIPEPEFITATGLASVMCSAGFAVTTEAEDSTRELTQFTSPDGVPLAFNYLTQDFPAEYRRCQDTSDLEAESWPIVTCDQPHTQQTAFVFDPVAVWGQAWVDAFYAADDPDNYDEAAVNAAYAEGDPICREALAALYPDIPDDVRVYWQPEDSSWSPEEGWYISTCDYVAPEGYANLFVGSLLGLDGPPEYVPAA